jgi:hypothetical protein
VDDDLAVAELETPQHPLVAQARTLRHLLYAINLLAVVFVLVVAIDRGYGLEGLAVAAWMTAVTVCVAWLLERWEESAAV